MKGKALYTCWRLENGNVERNHLNFSSPNRLDIPLKHYVICWLTPAAKTTLAAAEMVAMAANLAAAKTYTCLTRCTLFFFEKRSSHNAVHQQVFPTAEESAKFAAHCAAVAAGAQTSAVAVKPRAH